MFTNEHEIDQYVRTFRPEYYPNLSKAARTLDALRDYSNNNSDGWPYWQKPLNASRKLQELLCVAFRDLHSVEIDDCSDATLTVALSPVKAFLTRQGVDHAEVFGGAPVLAYSTTPMWIVYQDSEEVLHYQPYNSLVYTGTLTDPETGDDMPVMGWTTTDPSEIR